MIGFARCDRIMEMMIAGLRANYTWSLKSDARRKLVPNSLLTAPLASFTTQPNNCCHLPAPDAITGLSRPAIEIRLINFCRFLLSIENARCGGAAGHDPSQGSRNSDRKETKQKETDTMNTTRNSCLAPLTSPTVLRLLFCDVICVVTSRVGVS